MSQDRALILDRRQGALLVMPVPRVAPDDHQIAVRVHAVAINPVDRYMQPLARFITPWLRYPAVLGSDVAGEIVAIGPKVSRFSVGQHVLGLALGTEKGRDRAEGAFQDRVILDEYMVSPIPDDMAFADAATLPLGLCTAASGLFQRDYLGLRHPSGDVEPAGQSVLVWGGATSVGSQAIQLAVRAGYDVVTTASPHNHGYVIALGARAAFDYRSASVVPDLVTALQGRRMAGAMAIGEGSLARCIAVLRRAEGRRFVAVATPGLSFDTLLAKGTAWHRLLPFFTRMGLLNARDALAARRAGVTTKFIWGSSLKDNEVGQMLFRDYLPRALAEGRHIAAPPALVTGHGLEAIPAALEAQASVSARKIVVKLGTRT
ncbi:NADPH:quinone reductase [Ameyamaea chiangmaiensis NBRC 103196]|uniref:Zinc-binding alcohol dehydrogenase family protein n=1 Tax=Ameyamaea chiangmaiensis TaxID=442969 RepID=A0A850PCQ5_9PROT|nr:zinc-binding alcohol dehydrogenase family protein [Ameyamaea chiangmaiensis]MBS4075581.1 zinc-binding alcohol dehydrogenase family protein [Ameyamaea chiangmaiensis]NVN40290.1 zinc-binding alcohol dehydrogenase family protein [Ameyamaea chiangmaiensis]GBQ70881.1 NADPH:quinone reductase [Ameyamaea chiangmaiensis NBRC 103196]